MNILSVYNIASALIFEDYLKEFAIAAASMAVQGS